MVSQRIRKRAVTMLCEHFSTNGVVLSAQLGFSEGWRAFHKLTLQFPFFKTIAFKY